VDLSGSPPLGLAHFTAIAVPPLELVSLAARTGYAAVGLRLYPAFPGAPFSEIPAGSAASHEMQERLRGKGIRVYDIEFVTLSQGFAPASLIPVLEAASALGARRLSVCGDDPEHTRMVEMFATLCDLAAPFGIGVDLECMAWRRVSSFPQAVQVVSEAGRANGGVLVDALHLSRTGGTREDVRQTPAHSCVMPSRNDHPPTRPSSRKRAQIACCQAAAHCRCAISWTCSRPRRSYRSRCRWTVPPQPSSMCGTYSCDAGAVRRLPHPKCELPGSCH
jgi:xylose isomerase-like TIM barrel protein